MKNFKMNLDEFNKSFDEDDFIIVGVFDAQKVYINEVDFIVCIQRHVNELDFFEFDQSECTDIEFKYFALKWCEKVLPGFKTVKEKKEEEALNVSNLIYDFLRYGQYGAQKIFASNTGDLEITIIPGGAIYRFTGSSPVFVPYSEFEKELAIKK